MEQGKEKNLISCWNCKYQQIGGDNFLGNCTYFESIGKGKKEIPPHIADKGCKFFIDKTKHHTLYEKAIEMFDGGELK